MRTGFCGYFCADAGYTVSASAAAAVVQIIFMIVFCLGLSSAKAAAARGFNDKDITRMHRDFS